MPYSLRLILDPLLGFLERGREQLINLYEEAFGPELFVLVLGVLTRGKVRMDPHAACLMVIAMVNVVTQVPLHVIFKELKQENRSPLTRQQLG
jgi:hypothetical protein